MDRSIGGVFIVIIKKNEIAKSRYKSHVLFRNLRPTVSTTRNRYPPFPSHPVFNRPSRLLLLSCVYCPKSLLDRCSCCRIVCFQAGDGFYISPWDRTRLITVGLTMLEVDQTESTVGRLMAFRIWLLLPGNRSIELRDWFVDD